jgi:hypothetical protein
MGRSPDSNADSENEDWVNVSIQDNREYEFVSYRTIGVFSGKGDAK